MLSKSQALEIIARMKEQQMSAQDTVIIVGRKGSLIAEDVILKAITKFPMAAGFAAIDAENEVIIQGKGNLDTDTPIENHVKGFMEEQKKLKDTYKVFWFSKKTVTEESLQPFSVVSVTEGEGEDEEEVDKIVAFLSGDFTAKVKEGHEHTGDFWSFVEDVRPAVLEMLVACADSEGVADMDTVKKDWEKNAPKICAKMLADNAGIVLLTPTGDCLIYGEKGGEGHSEQDYWISTLLDDPPPVEEKKPTTGVLIGSKKKAKATTSSVPIVTPKEVVEDKPNTVKMKPPAWACGSTNMTKQWYEIANALRDSKGHGVVPSNHAKIPPVDVDPRILEFKGSNLKDFRTFCDTFRNHVTEKAPPAVGPTSTVFIKTLTAEEKSRVEKEFVPLVKSGNSPAEIQDDEKQMPTFKEVTGMSFDDLKKCSFKTLCKMDNPKLAWLVAFDLMHRPLGTVSGKVGASQPDTHAIVPAKKKAGGVKVA